MGKTRTATPKGFGSDKCDYKVCIFRKVWYDVVMYSASSILAKARTYYIPRRRKSLRTKIHMVGKKRTQKYRYYYGDRDFYRNHYLKSEHWKELRAKKLQINPVCEKCGSDKRVEPHHLIYKNLHDIRVEDLMTLCRICHNKEHKISMHP